MNKNDNPTVEDESRIGQVNIPRMGRDDATGIRRALSTQVRIHDILLGC